MPTSKLIPAFLCLSLLIVLSKESYAKEQVSTLERIGWGSALTAASCVTIAPTLPQKNRWLLLGAACVPIAAVSWMPPAFFIDDEGVRPFAREFLTMHLPLALGTFGGLFVSEKEEGRIWGAGASGFWGSFVGRGLDYLYVDSESAWSKAAMYTGGTLAGGALAYAFGTSTRKRHVLLMTQALGSVALVSTGVLYAQIRKFRGDISDEETKRMQVAFVVAGIGIGTLVGVVAAALSDNADSSTSQTRLPTIGSFSLGQGLSLTGQF